MADEKRNDYRRLLDKLITVLVGFPCPEAATEAWKIVRRAMQSRSYPGMYEVLEQVDHIEGAVVYLT